MLRSRHRKLLVLIDSSTSGKRRSFEFLFGTQSNLRPRTVRFWPSLWRCPSMFIPMISTRNNPPSGFRLMTMTLSIYLQSEYFRTFHETVIPVWLRASWIMFKTKFVMPLSSSCSAPSSSSFGGSRSCHRLILRTMQRSNLPSGGTILALLGCLRNDCLSGNSCITKVISLWTSSRYARTPQGTSIHRQMTSSTLCSSVRWGLRTVRFWLC